MVDYKTKATRLAVSLGDQSAGSCDPCLVLISGVIQHTMTDEADTNFCVSERVLLTMVR